MRSTFTIPVILITAISLIILASCSSKMQFMQSTVVPAAEGTVKVKKDKNDNYRVDIDVVGLAQPDRLTPPANTYVVWMETKDYGMKNLGQLRSSSSLLSKTLKASLNAVTSFEPRTFIITGEENGAVQYPSSQVVLRTAN